ncbi:hypothetical protein GGF41_001255, partial [Coemansia sp. RSA 2531]
PDPTAITLLNALTCGTEHIFTILNLSVAIYITDMTTTNPPTVSYKVELTIDGIIPAQPIDRDLTNADFRPANTGIDTDNSDTGSE